MQGRVYPCETAATSGTLDPRPCCRPPSSPRALPSLLPALCITHYIPLSPQRRHLCCKLVLAGSRCSQLSTLSLQLLPHGLSGGCLVLQLLGNCLHILTWSAAETINSGFSSTIICSQAGWLRSLLSAAELSLAYQNLSQPEESSLIMCIYSPSSCASQCLCRWVVNRCHYQ